jgi:hypothetical protein
MNANSRQNIMTLSLRWIARAASLLSIGTILLFLVGFNPGSVRPKEWVGLAFFPAGVVIGMLIAWWKEVVGACITLMSLAGFYGVYGWVMGSNVNSLAFIVFASPGFLFLIAWWLSRRHLSEVTT